MNGPSLAISGSNLCGDVAVSCALRIDGRIDARRSPAGGRGDLAALVAELCAANGVNPAQLSELRVDVGPGSYTGLRVAVTFARFLQHFGKLPVLAVDSLALMALRARATNAARVRAVLDARRGRYHHGAFRWQDGQLTTLESAAAVPLPKLFEATSPGDHFVMPASLVAQLGSELSSRGATLQAIAEVTAEDLFATGLPLVDASFADLEPRYLMASYAED